MAIAEAQLDVPGITRPMTYEEYLASPEEMARYDILDGWKVYRLYGDNLLPSPTRRHQTIALNLADGLRRFQRATRQGQAIIAPCDVQITYQPLRSRQPDLLFISRARLAENAPADEYSPLAPAPELVIEIISPADTRAILAGKIADYQSVAVQELWIVRSEEQTVEVLRLSANEFEAIRTYQLGDAVVSLAFDGLSVALDDIFAEE